MLPPPLPSLAPFVQNYTCTVVLAETWLILGNLQHVHFENHVIETALRIYAGYHTTAKLLGHTEERHPSPRPRIRRTVQAAQSKL